MDQNNGSFSAAIVTYKNPDELLLRAINSCLETPLLKCIFIIDNSPTDEIRHIVADKRIIYIHNPANPGFGAAHNLAIKKAMEFNLQYHLVLNPDVYFEKGTIEKIVNYLDQNPDVGNLMPKVLYPNGDVQYLCKLLPTPYDWIGRRFNPIKSQVEKRNNMFELRFTGYNKVMEVPYLSGCFMFLNISIIKQVGLFDENIFMYGEETDLCRRIIQCGYKTVFYPGAQVYHHFEKGSHKSFKLTKIGMQSAIYYFNKWGWFFDKQRSNINHNTLNRLKSTQRNG